MLGTYLLLFVMVQKSDIDKFMDRNLQSGDFNRK